MVYYVFNPMHFDEYALSNKNCIFFNGDGYQGRIIYGKKLLGLYKYSLVPFGPIAENKKGFINFLKYISQLRFQKISIELPMIYDEVIKAEVDKILRKFNFRKADYEVHEDETLFTFKDKFKLNSKTRYKVRKSKKSCIMEFEYSPDSSVLNRGYRIYRKTAKRIGYQFRSYKAFEKLAKKSILGLAVDKKSKEDIGFILGYIQIYHTNGLLKKNKAKICQILLSGTTKKGRDDLAGYGLRKGLIDSAFSKQGVEIIDSVGASRKVGESYVVFKKEFANDFYPLPGNYILNKSIL